MPAPAIGVRPRWAPGPSAQIDWSHPLAQGLSQCVTGGGNARGSLLGIPAVSSLIRNRGNYGFGWSNNGTNTETALAYTLPGGGTGGWTHFAAVTVTSVAVSTAVSVYRVGTPSTTDRTLGIYTGNVWATYIFDGATKYATAAAAAVGPAVVVGTSSGSAIQTWVNGVPGTATATSNAGFGYSGLATYWSIGRTGNAANGFGGANAAFPGVVHIAATWDRVLSGSEIAMLTDNPFCFLRF